MALCVTMLCSQYLCARQMTIGIDDMFRIADERNSSIKMYGTKDEAAAEAVKAAKSQRLPEIGVAASVGYLGNGRIWDRDFGNGSTVAMPHFGNNFSIEARQTVYAGGAIRSGIKLAELGKEMAELDYNKNRQEIRFMLVADLLEICKADNYAAVLRENIALAERIIKDMNARLEQGTALKNDITRYELQKENLKLQLTQVLNGRSILNHRLATALHLPDGSEIVPDSAITTDSMSLPPENFWHESAKAGNIDLKQVETSLKIAGQNVKSARSEMIPHISLFAADHLDGPITIEVPVLDNNFNYWSVGISLEYSLSSLFKNNRQLKKAKIEQRQAEEYRQVTKEQVDNAVQAGYTDYLTALSGLETQKKSVELANENYSIISNRYSNGLALLTDMLDASNAKIDAELGLANARIAVIYSQYKIKYIVHSL